LPDGKGCDPDWNQPVLTKRQSDIGVSLDLKNKFPVPSRVEKRVLRRPSERKPAQNERARAEDQVLPTVFLVPVEYLNLSQSLANKRCHRRRNGIGAMRQKGKKREK
jgi:hypothetical protein